MNQTILQTCENHICTITLNSPQTKNALSDAFCGEITRVLQKAEQDDQIRVIVLEAAGDYFCAGADLKMFENGPPAYLNSNFMHLLAQLIAMQKPIVAKVQGVAIGGGSTILLHCDFAYAELGTRFQLPFTHLGLAPEFGSSFLLGQFAGMRLANELLLLGQPFDCDKAKAAGFINEAVPRDELETKVMTTAKQLARLAPQAMRNTKRLIKEGLRERALAAMDMEGAVLDRAFQGAELDEALKAFFGKRPPDFSNFK